MIHTSPTTKLICCFNQDNCDDDYVGKITYKGNRFVGPSQQHPDLLCLEKQSVNKKTKHIIVQRQPVKYTSIKKNNESLRIVILLESPSNTEFKNKLSRNAPAMGKTGDRINSQFIKAMNRSNINSKISLKKDDVYELYFVNAIRYQCDLTYSGNRSIIKKIFTNLWNLPVNNFCDDLIERIQLLNPKIIINACTLDLRHLCSKNLLNNSFPNSCVFDASQHPTVWNSGNKNPTYFV